MWVVDELAGLVPFARISFPKKKMRLGQTARGRTSEMVYRPSEQKNENWITPPRP
jgi:hypothetical protein